VDDRDPHPLFDLSWYVTQNPKVATSTLHPLQHFLERGKSLGRDTNPLSCQVEQPVAERGSGETLFDDSWYLEQNPDVAASGVDPLLHYLKYGRFQGRDPHPSFNTKQPAPSLLESKMTIITSHS
jgi:hypothetical protein